ncbi:hypothetical protein WG66_000796 [Moniliophthora roreri]|nr:hypothetical protein WG66_000796 [Moniliophthora roreri]
MNGTIPKTPSKLYIRLSTNLGTSVMNFLELEPQVPAIQNGIASFMEYKIKGMVLWCVPSTTPYHWVSSYIFTDQGAGGISADMYRPKCHEWTQRNQTNYYGSLKITHRSSNKVISTRTPLKIEIPFTREVTVSDIYNLIVQGKRHQYVFNDAGSGCMFWQLDLIDHFIAMGWVDVRYKDSALQEIQKLATTKGELSVPYPAVKGTFV